MEFLRDESKRKWVHLGLFVAAALAQYLLFRTYVLREIVWGYPVNHDQTVFLTRSYTIYEQILNQSFFKAFRDMFRVLPMPQGFFLVLSSLALYPFLGASRLSALTVNLLYFILLQACLWKLVAKATGSRAWAWFALACLWSIRTPFFWAGGLNDFRSDFAAFCLYGVFVCFVIRSRAFLSRRGSVAAALAALPLLLTRFITLAYVGVTLALFACGLLVWAFARRESRPASLRRLGNVFISGGVMFSAVAPFLWLSRFAIDNYYVVGHLVGNEKNIRAQEAGIHNLFEHLTYYPKSLFWHHMGHEAVILVGSALFAGMAAWILTGRKPDEDRLEGAGAAVPGETLFFLILAIAAPMAVLTADVAKSPVVIGILTVPALLLCTLLSARWLERSAVGAASSVRIGLAAVALCVGLHFQAKGYMGRGPFSGRESDVKQISRMYGDIAEYCERTGNATPGLSVNSLNDYLGNLLLDVEAYERRGFLMNVIGKLGHSIFNLSQADALKFINESDVVILKDRQDPSHLPYPFYEDICRLEPLIEKQTLSQFELLNRYPLQTATMNVYVRPFFRISGIQSDGWITADGLELLIPGSISDKAAAVEFTADCDVSKFPQGIRASAVSDDGKKFKVIVFFSGYRSTVRCFLPRGLKGALDIRITFANYIVPKDMGVNPDDRKLVMINPGYRKITWRSGEGS